MCGPAVIPLAAAALMATGKVVGGINANNQARYEASIAHTNAGLDRKASQDAIERGQIEERRQYQKNAQVVGQQRAALAANGIQTDFGSAAVVTADAARIGAEDADTIRRNTMREANGFEISAFNSDAQAAGAKARGKSALIGSLFDAGGTILSGASQNAQMRSSRSGRAA